VRLKAQNEKANGSNAKPKAILPARFLHETDHCDGSFLSITFQNCAETWWLKVQEREELEVNQNALGHSATKPNNEW
jgi:hypothetical protein